MIKRSIIILAFLAANVAIPSAPVTGLAQSSSAESREEQIYNNARASLTAQRWQNAIDQLSQIRGSKSDGAAYWKAYAQNKLGQRAAALETIGLMMKQYPRSTYINDAKALEIEIRGAAGQGAQGVQDAVSASQGDEDLKLYAINSLMSADPERAVPALEKLLAGSQSARLKERALFVLSQSSSSRAQDLMAQIARGQVYPDLQSKAIQNLGISGKKKLLSDIYTSGASAEAKRAALKAMGIAGATDELVAAARSERDPQVRREIINSLAIAGGREQLRQLYKEATDTQTKRDLLRSANITGDQELLMNALSDPDVEIKRDAVRTLGVAGGQDAVARLVNIYNSDKDRSIRDAAVDGLFIRGAAHEMVDLAKKETDVEAQKRLISKLAIMNNKEVTDYMIQVLEK
jgi:HEAT repeat protein